jgi:predicted RNase H-like nuclease (RuvC/YqgF family)
MHLKLSQGSNQDDSSSHQLHQIISEDGEPLIVAADSYVGDDSVEALEAQVCAHIFDNVIA